MIHSAIIYFVTKISIRYFKHDKTKAQLICFILVANEEVREIN